MESSSTPRYTRGPYNKIYKEKYHSKKETTYEDLQILLQELIKFREKINSLGTSSSYKSKILENNQGLIDCLRHRVKHLEKDKTTLDPQQLIIQKLEKIEKRLDQIETRQDESLDLTQFPDIQEYYGNSL